MTIDKRLILRLLPLLLLLAAAVAAADEAEQVKVNCFPERRQTEDPGRDACLARGCTYVSSAESDSPRCLWHRAGYRVVRSEQGQHQAKADVRKDADYAGPFPASPDEDELSLEVKAISDDAMRISLTDRSGVRFTVPQAALDIPEVLPPSGQPALSWHFDANSDFFVRLTRPGSEEPLLEFQRPGFVFSDQFIQLPLRLGCERIYGLGEHNHERLLHDRNYKRWTIWTRDMSPVAPVNLYSAHPYFVCGDSRGYVGLLLKNANAMEIELTPTGVVYRLLGGVLDFYAFVGDTPEAVTRAYSMAIGHPLMPSYWALGFQLCRWGYEDIEHVRDVIRRNRAIGLPYDIQYGDIDYMRHTMDFTIDHEKYVGLDKMVEDLHQHEQRYFVILDPAISSDEELHKRVLPSGRYEPYHDGLAKNVFVKNSDGSVHEGEVWPGRTVFPDFSRPATEHWWEYWVRDFYYNQSIKIDGLWIDMNEPASFTYEPHKPANCTYNKWNYPPYIPTSFLGDRFYEKTICMETVQDWGIHYNTHSLYGHAMAIQSYNTLRRMFPDKRPIVFGRSTFPGTGRYAQHWLGDNYSRWRDMRWSIVAMIEFGLFGFPYTGADICGFVFDAERQMCVRWTQLGAFYPFSRNHNVKEADGRKTIEQDPASWDSAAQEIMKNALFLRYKYLPYLYTLFHYAHTQGATVVRSLNHEFPSDEKTVSLDRQFLWGSSLLISPVLEANVTSVEAYLPADGWYDVETGIEEPSTGFVTLDAPLEKINVHVRKGAILPWQKPEVTTPASRRNPLGLLVALQRKAGQPMKFSAEGSLFWDDGESFETFKSGKYILHNFKFYYDEEAEHHVLKISAVQNGYTDPNSIGFKTVVFYGLLVDYREHEFFVNDRRHDSVIASVGNSTVVLDNLELGVGQDHEISMRRKAACGLAGSALMAMALALLACLARSLGP